MRFVRQGRWLGGPTLFSLLLVLAASCLPARSQTNSMVLRLATQEMPPYQLVLNGKLDGIAVKVVQCVLAKLRQPYMIAEFPWRRAQMLVEAGVYDGFFAASRTSQRDRFAVLSEPIADQSWRWYWPSASKLDPESEQFKANGTVGALAGSSMLNWLVDNNYRISTHATSSEQLFAQLLYGRTDAILSNEAMPRTWLRKNAVRPGMFNEQTFTKVPAANLRLGVYFSREYLTRNPNFLPQFNRHIASCR